jgi:Domain of unknown function (DUF4129)
VSDRGGTAARLAALGAALVGLLALVALAARAGVPWSGGSSGAEGRSLALVGRLVVDAILVGFAVLLLGVFIIRMRRPELGLSRGPDAADDSEDDEPQSRVGRFVLRVGPYVLVGTILVATLLFARELDRRFPRGEPPRVTTEQPRPEAGPQPAPPTDTAGWVLALAGGLVVAALVVATATPVARRRLAARTATVQPEAERMTRVLDESIDDLRAEPNPRRAVIAAYARMERGLAARGHGRQASDTPLEHLSRVLADLGAERERVRRLAALFERAEFSLHPVGTEAKDEAIDCLVAIRGGLG